MSQTKIEGNIEIIFVLVFSDTLLVLVSTNVNALMWDINTRVKLRNRNLYRIILIDTELAVLFLKDGFTCFVNWVLNFH